MSLSKVFQSAAALSLLLTNAEARPPHVREMHDDNSVDLVHTKKIVQALPHGFFGYDYSITHPVDAAEDDLAWGFECAFNIDLGVGYEALLFWILREGKNLLIMNPSLFFEVSSHSWLAFKLYFFEIRINLDLTGYKITPVDY